MNREELFDHLRDNTKVLTDETLEQAFELVDRADFVPEDYVIEAYEDYAIPVGFEQTLTQPSTTAFMLELLGASEGDNVLNIGAGTGYSTALLATIVGPEGSVTALEVLPELAEIGQENLEKYDFQNARILLTDPRWSPTENQTYDKILVNASADELPASLLPKLNPGGTLVLPVGDSLYKIEKITEEEITDEEFPGFRFAPLV